MVEQPTKFINLCDEANQSDLLRCHEHSMYCFTGEGSGSGVKRRDRSIDTENLLTQLPSNLREHFPECQVFDALASLTAELDEQLLRSDQIHSSYVTRNKVGGSSSLVARGTLRILLYNVYEQGRYNVSEGAPLAQPSWTFRVEAFLSSAPNVRSKFSQLVRRVVVETRDKPGSTLEWDSRKHLQEESLGVEMTRTGEQAVETDLQVTLDIAHAGPVYRVSPEMQKIIHHPSVGEDGDTALASVYTHETIIRQFWVYIVKNSVPLVEPDSGTFQCDQALQAALQGRQQFTLAELPRVIRPLLLPVAPVVLPVYRVKTSGSVQQNAVAYDVPIVLPTSSSSSSSSSGRAFSSGQADAKMSALLTQLAMSARLYSMYKSMASDPAHFIHHLVLSFGRDEQFLEQQLKEETLSSATFYENPYVSDALQQYLLRTKLALAENADAEAKEKSEKKQKIQ